MTRLEFCKAVHEKFDFKWPFPGSLAFMSNCYDKKATVDETVIAIGVEKDRLEQERKRAR